MLYEVITREEIVAYAAWLESRRGIVYLANVLVGDVVELAPRRPAALQQLTQFCNEKNYAAFPVVVAAEQLEQGISMMMQATAIGPIRRITSYNVCYTKLLRLFKTHTVSFFHRVGNILPHSAPSSKRPREQLYA